MPFPEFKTSTTPVALPSAVRVPPPVLCVNVIPFFPRNVKRKPASLLETVVDAEFNVATRLVVPVAIITSGKSNVPEHTNVPEFPPSGVTHRGTWTASK